MLLGVGAATAATGGVFAVLASGAVGLTGLVLAIVAPSSEAQQASALDINVGADRVGASWTLRF